MGMPNAFSGRTERRLVTSDQIEASHTHVSKSFNTMNKPSVFISKYFPSSVSAENFHLKKMMSMRYTDSMNLNVSLTSCSQTHATLPSDSCEKLFSEVNVQSHEISDSEVFIKEGESQGLGRDQNTSMYSVAGANFAFPVCQRDKVIIDKFQHDVIHEEKRKSLEIFEENVHTADSYVSSSNFNSTSKKSGQISVSLQQSRISSTKDSETAYDDTLHTTGKIDMPARIDNGLCQVCGDVAAGFYCGAFICEACKKFFIRASKQEKQKFVCLRRGMCKITKENRVQCQYCRYQKCLGLHMYYPGEGKRTVNAVGISDIPCRVCSAPSSGFHFGALTCEGCKGFFRRMVKEREAGSYKCSSGGTCEISAQTRNMCKACRYNKCIGIGMSVEASRIGRQPNAVKHAISLEVKRKSLEASLAPPIASTFLSPETLINTANASPQSQASPCIANSCRPIKQEPDVSSDFSFTDVELLEVSSVPPLIVKAEPKDIELHYEELADGLQLAGRELSHMCNKERAKSDIFDEQTFSSVPSLWKRMMSHFEFHAKCTIRFAKKIPGFRKLTIDDQVTLVQLAIYPIVIMNHSRCYELETGFYNYFNFSKHEEEAIMSMCPELRALQEHFRHMGIMAQSMNLDETEYTLLSCLLLVDNECPGLKDRTKVQELHENLLQFFQAYEEKKYVNGASRFGEMLLRISELALSSVQHGQAISALLTTYPDLEVPQLYKEMFF